MEIGHIIPHIEALIFASDRPLAPMEITELINNAFGFMEDKITLEQVQASVEGIVEKYSSEFYPFELRESGGGYQFLTKKEYHKTVAQLNGDKFLKRLSPAALETLAIIAYKQPITKGEIESIRGVSCDYSIQKLLEKELIVITGRNEDMPGKPLVYATSKTFMDYFGLNSPDELPKLKEVFEENNVAPTTVTDDGNAPFQGEEVSEDVEDGSRNFVVTQDGELLEAAVEAPETGETSEAATDNDSDSDNESSELTDSTEITEEELSPEDQTSAGEDFPSEEDDKQDESKQDEEDKPSEQ